MSWKTVKTVNNSFHYATSNIISVLSKWYILDLSWYIFPSLQISRNQQIISKYCKIINVFEKLISMLYLLLHSFVIRHQCRSFPKQTKHSTKDKVLLGQFINWNVFIYKLIQFANWQRKLIKNYPDLKRYIKLIDHFLVNWINRNQLTRCLSHDTLQTKIIPE